MITFHIFTIFPDIFFSYFNESILKRAQKRGLIKIKIYNIRDFAKDKHRTTDDRPFGGGGAGMVLKIEPLIRAISSILMKLKIKNSKLKIILLSPSGKQFTQKTAREFADKYSDIVFICGHYEGIDARIRKVVPDLAREPARQGFGISDLSIGPYVLTGGELPAMAIVDAVSRHIFGVLGKHESLEEIKGSCPAYTRPEVLIFKGKKYRAPKVLLSGNHKKIQNWRNKHQRKFL